jgi:hypothetical protein
MSFRLHSLLTLRRQEEEQAEQAAAVATAARVEAETEQKRLDDLAVAARQRLAQAREKAWRDQAGVRGADAALRAERLRQRLADEIRQAAAAAEGHRTGALAAALAAEQEARRRRLEARQAREALEKVKARADAEDQKLADRRAEDAASDLAIAGHRRQDR